MSTCRRRRCARECAHAEGKVGCRGAAEGVAAMASATGWEPEVGAGPGPRVGGSDRAEVSSELSLEPPAPDHHVPRQRGRAGGPGVCAPHILSTAKPLGIYLSLSVSGCARLCLCACCRLCVCACLCLRMYLSLCLSVCGGWSRLVHKTVSGVVCVYVYLCLWGTGSP